MEKGKCQASSVSAFQNERHAEDAAAERRYSCNPYRSDRKQCHSFIISILLGQLLAMMIAATAASSGLLAEQKISLPISQNMPHYFLLFVCYGAYKLFRYKNRVKTAKEATVKTATEATTANYQTDAKNRLTYYGAYILAGLIDVHANWALVSAYAYTSVTSVQLLDCTTIPVAMLLSCLLLRHRYSWIHILSTLICLSAAGGMIAVDVMSARGSGNSTGGLNQTADTDTQPSNPALGDILVVLGAIGYAVSNVLQQYLVSKYSFVDFIVYAGFTAFLSTLVYSIVLERPGLTDLLLHANQGKVGEISAYFAIYAGAMFVLYSLMPYALARSGAVFVNLSLLTADVYALLMGIYLFKHHFNGFYILCFVFILFGLVLFTLRKPSISATHYSWCPNWLIRRVEDPENTTQLDLR